MSQTREHLRENSQILFMLTGKMEFSKQGKKEIDLKIAQPSN